MISIRKADEEQQRAEELTHLVRDSYRQAVNSTSQYAIEVDAAETKQFREHLRTLSELVDAAQGEDAWRALQSSFRGELRDYHDRTANQVINLRQQIRVASEAVQLFAENVTAIDSDHEVQLKGTLRSLNTLAASPEAEALRESIQSAVNAISESIQQMRRRHQTAIAELRQEIRVLHKHIEGERKAHLLDSGTGVWSRQNLETKIDELVEKDVTFCLMVVNIQNLPRLDVRYSRGIVDGALKSLLKRFETMLTEGALVGRWDNQNFAALLHLEPAAANALSRLATKNLAADYTIQENGVSQSVWLQAAAGVVERSGACDGSALRKKLQQMMDTLSDA